MSRTPARVKKSEVTCFVKAVAAAGMPIGEVEVDLESGTITVKTRIEGDNPATELQKWEAKRNARPS